MTTASFPPRSQGRLIVLLAAIAMNGTAAMHIFVPALADVAASLQTTPRAAQLTITVYLAGLALGQLVCGPISDLYGRRRPLIVGLVLYGAGLLLAAAAPSIGVLLAARLLQSAGACAALVLSRSMVHDIAGPEHAARHLATLGLIMLMTPALAPVLGNAIDLWLGWRAIFVVMAVVIAVLLALVLRALPETGTPQANRSGLWHEEFGGMARGYATLLRHATFRRFLIAGACATTSAYGFLAEAPFLLVGVLHQPRARVGLWCMVTVLGMAAGVLTARRAARRRGVLAVARLGNVVALVSALALAAFCLAHAVTLPGLIGLMMLYSAGVGIVSPNALAGLMGAAPGRAGAASSLYGCLQMATGALFSMIGTLHFGPPALPVAISLLIAAGISAAVLRGRVN